MTCLLSAIHTRVRSTFTIYFSATEDTDIEKKKKREESEDDTPTKKLPYPKQIFFIISMEACERFSYYGMNSKDIKNYLRTFNEVNLSAILTIYLIHLFERIYSREVGRVAIFPFQSSSPSLESGGCQLHHLPRLQVRLLRLIAHRCGLGGLFRREIQARIYCGQGVGHLTILSRTILYIGIMYAIGQSVLALGAVGNGPEVRLTILPLQNIEPSIVTQTNK